MAKESAAPFAGIAAVQPTKTGESSPGLELVQNFLVRFGYLEEATYQPEELDGQTSTALQKYQGFNGIQESGIFDDSTQRSMTQSRCAMPDLDHGIDFATQCSWKKWSLSFALDVGTADCADEFIAVRNAFRSWSAVVPLTFTQVGTAAAPDIRVGWRPANDPDHSMVGGVLAHADFPPGCSVVTNGLPKPVHFDDTEHHWTIGAVAGGFDVETVALHEIGHIIGLGHSGVAGSVMFPTVSANSTKRGLTPDDINGARALYPHQADWRWCSKCEGMFFGGNANPVCPAGGPHTKAGSGNYVLAHNMAVTPGWQRDWRWCRKCQGLHFGGNPNPVCPSGGTHDKTGSGNYSLPFSAGVAPGQQDNWRWCRKCQGLAYGGHATSGVCPSGGSHDKAGSGNYSIAHR
ncbi:matrixin family metalloprotease [Streptomyces sp. NPDC054863]